MADTHCTKRCRRCGTEKLLTDFHRLAESADGRQPRCKACTKAVSAANSDQRREYAARYRRENGPKARFAQARWYRQNKERHYANGKAWIAANKELAREYQRTHYWRHRDKRIANTRAWKAANSEKDSERKKAYNAANRARIREYEQEYRRVHPEVGRRKDLNKRARQHAAFVEVVDRDVLYRRDNGVCGICHKRVRSEDASVDHIVPLARGGEHSYRNTQLAHRRCNARKGATTVGQLRLIG